VRRSRCKDHRVIEIQELGYRDVAANGDVANEIDAGAFSDLVVSLRNRLQRLVVGSDAEADQPVGHRIAVEDVDARFIAIGLLQRLGGVEARGARADDREMAHARSSSLLRSNGEVAAQSADGGASHHAHYDRGPCTIESSFDVPLPSAGGGKEDLAGMILEQDAAAGLQRRLQGAGKHAEQSGQKHRQMDLAFLNVDGRLDGIAHRRHAHVELVAGPAALDMTAARNVLGKAMDVVGDPAARLVLAEVVRQVDFDGL